MAATASPMNTDDLQRVVANDPSVLEQLLAIYNNNKQQEEGLPGNVVVPRISTIGQVAEGSTSSLSQEDVSYLNLTGVK